MDTEKSTFLSISSPDVSKCVFCDKPLELKKAIDEQKPFYTIENSKVKNKILEVAEKTTNGEEVTSRITAVGDANAKCHQDCFMFFFLKEGKQIETNKNWYRKVVSASLFNDKGNMRTTVTKPLFNTFDQFVSYAYKANNLEQYYVVDGGFLIYELFNYDTNSVPSCSEYLNYLKIYLNENEKFFKNCKVIFDGYDNTANSTKRHTQNQRREDKKKYLKTTTVITANTRTTTWRPFFSDDDKSQFINELRNNLEDNGIQVDQSTDDADFLIVNTAIELSKSNKYVVIIGSDVDILVLLTALALPKKEICFIKYERNTKTRKMYSSIQLKEYKLANSIVFIHAFTGCDTTSASYKKGKAKCIKLFEDNINLKDLKDIPQVFNNSKSSHEDIARAGERMFLALYGASATDKSLSDYQFECFVKLVIEKKKPSIESIALLPPTERVAKQHSFRVYHQVQAWKGNNLNAEEWGWQRTEHGLEPIIEFKDESEKQGKRTTDAGEASTSQFTKKMRLE